MIILTDNNRKILFPCKDSLYFIDNHMIGSLHDFITVCYLPGKCIWMCHERANSSACCHINETTKPSWSGTDLPLMLDCVIRHLLSLPTIWNVLSFCTHAYTFDNKFLSPLLLNSDFSGNELNHVYLSMHSYIPGNCNDAVIIKKFLVLQEL